MDVELNQKQSKKMTIFAFLLSFFSIGLLIFGFLLISSEKVVMLQSISNLTSQLDLLLENYQELVNHISTSNDVSLNTWADATILDEELKNQLSFSNRQLWNLDFSFQNQKVYFSMDELTSKHYSSDLNYYSMFLKLNSNDYDQILSYFKDAIRNIVDNQKITKEKVTISYHGKDKKVNRLTYTLTNSSLKEIITTFIQYLKQDQKLLEHMAFIHSLSVDEITKNLDLLVESIDFKDDIGLTYQVYYYGFNQIIRYELETSDQKYQITYQLDQKQTLEFYQNNDCLLQLIFPSDKKNISFSGFFNQNQKEIPFQGTIDHDNITVTFSYNEEQYQISLQGHNDFTENSVYYQMRMEVSTLLDYQEQPLMTIDFYIEYLKSTHFNPSLEDVYDIHNIPEEEIMMIKDQWLVHPLYQFLKNFDFTLSFLG